MHQTATSRRWAPKTALAAGLAALLVLSTAPGALGQDRRDTAPGGGWTLIEQEPLFGEESVFVRHRQDGTEFELGCFRRQMLNLIWTPADTSALPDQVTVQYRVNGAIIGTQTHLMEAAQGRFWASRLTRRPGPPGLVVDVLVAIAQAGGGEITLSAHEGWSDAPEGPALVTHTIVFDQDELNEISERILTACPLP